ncbi:hypothetical protein DFH29DRAFT_295474 [Suillus ampliporus]|nr:hypothetical protein DFH29DRAFT_295474 [Suillus ampliporus]
MHQVLLVSEILLDIFVHLLGPESSVSVAGKSLSRKSLAALARTCKTFYEAAINLLWADMDGHGIDPLLGCVTRLHPIIYRHGTRHTWYSEGIKPLSEHEARHFLRHSARVRSLHLSSNEHFHLLSVLPIKTCVFPRLLSLSWMISTDICLRLFLSPMLRRCVVSLPTLRSDFKSIGAHCAMLEDLFIPTIKQTAKEQSLLSEVVSSCKRLKYLYCPPLDSAAWKHLSNLPTLLTVSILGKVLFPSNHGNLDFAPFLNVTALSFLQTAADIATVIQRLEFPSLKQLRIRAGPLCLLEAEQLLRALSQCKACLEHIDIDICFYSCHRHVQHHSHSANSFTAIKQCLCFVQLQTLRIFVDRSISLDNDLFLEAMSSWPHIRSLELVVPYFNLPNITFRGLFAALRLCPHLHTLQVLIDAVNIDIDPEAESFQHTSLRNFGVCSSKVADAEAVARIIFSVLPCVDRVSYHQNGGSHLVWNDVNKQLKSLAALGPRIIRAAPKT